MDSTANLLAALKSNAAQQAAMISNAKMTSLTEAALSGNVERVTKVLQEEKVKVDQKDSDGVSALMHASTAGHIDVVRVSYYFILFFNSLRLVMSTTY